ncbi:hypothetical protein [Mycobacterium sp.]|uniref:Rv0361 family membrane protein n=1 Tax=Mycobacterium sp. TaxID=1785 RepID=UPI002CE44D21|nr:hypothetical protein [Mycobacterium sp.]HTY31304.1 hypothetical protein [Mycobacterium sp.]
MPNAPEPDRGATPRRGERAFKTGESTGEAPGEEGAEGQPMVPSDPETETVVINKPDQGDDPDANPEGAQRERRFTAPGFDAKETQVIATSAEPATEVFASTPEPEGATTQMGAPPKAAVPQSIPPRLGAKLQPTRQINWGWVLALVVVVLALAAIAILGTVLLTRGKHSKVSEEDQVRHAIQQYDVAVQRGDLTALRTITCGNSRDGYVDYDEHAWQETYQRVSAAKQYPVIASIDQVVVNGQHAEANVTTFMAYDPSLRSTRSLDLQYRDDRWKICQSPSG